MQKLKKYLAVFMSVLMIGTAVLTSVITASASDFTDVNPDDKYAEQIDLLSDIGVIKGTSEGEFSPNEKVTREQMALLLYRLMTGKDNAGTQNTSPFKDLYEPTYNGAISWAYACGFILGTSDTTFDPRGGITLQDALAMVTRALGQTNSSTNSGYPWSYINIANRLGLTDDLDDIDYGKTLTRAETAALLHSALTADYMITKTISGITVSETTTVLSYVYGYESGSAIIAATGKFALPGTSVVIRDGYALVIIENEDGTLDEAYVKVSDLGFADDINNHLGESMRVFYRINSSTGIASLLGAASGCATKEVNSFTYDSGKTYVNIGGIKYNVVSSFSGATATNANELIVFAFDNDETLTQLETNEALIAKEGYFTLKMIYENGSAKAKYAILMPLTLGTLEISASSEINLADGLTKNALTGGFVNPDGAVHGDNVLYYFNSTLNRLVIAEKLLEIPNVKVTRKTSTTATIGGKTYTLGVSGTAQDAEAIYALLTVGESYNIIVYGNSVIGVSDVSENETYASTYLIATSNTTPVVHADKVCYFMTANIGGKSTNIYTSNESVNVGSVYRYETDKDGIMTLIPASSDKFAQSSEVKVVIESASGVTITKGANVYYTLSEDTEGKVNFITDKDTIIVVGTPSGIIYKTGAYSSTFTVDDTAEVVAICENNSGSVKTLRYLYISSGALSSTVDETSCVMVLENKAHEYVDGTVLTAYTVYNFGTGKIETLYSSHADLADGNCYKLDENNRITSSEKVLQTGEVTGYAGNVVTIDGTTYKLASGAVIAGIEADANGNYTVKALSLSAIYGKTVSFIADGNEITRILLAD